jgi:Fe-S-cluster containining protein
VTRDADGVARVHLAVLGRERVVEAPLSEGATDVVALLPLARAVASAVAGLAEEDARAHGREVACRAGCAACCRHLVPVSVVEAVGLAADVAAMPPERRERVRRRFAEAVRRLEQLGLVDRKAPRGHRALRSAAPPGQSAWLDVSRRYFDAEIACPLLEEELCSVHPTRPLVCREYLVTTPPERCASLDAGAEAAARPLHTGEALAATARRVGLSDGPQIPLVLALEWADARGARLRAPREGAELFLAFVDEIERAAGLDPKLPSG